MTGITKRFYYGWLIVAAASSIEFANAATSIGILSIFVNPMSDDFGWTRTEIAGATSLGAVLGAALAPFSGRLIDKIGARAVLTLGGITVVLACLSLAVTHTLLGFYIAFTFTRTADQGLIKIGATTAVGKWFQRYRGRAVALVFFASSAGIIALAFVVEGIITQWGWRWSWVMLSGVMLVVGVIPSALLIRRLPEDMGLAVDGDPPQNSAPDPAQDSGVGVPATDSPTRPVVVPEVEWPLNQVVRTPTFWLILVSLFVASTANSGVGLHLVAYLTQQGLSRIEAVGGISIMSISGALAALALGFLAERVPAQRMLVFLYLLVAANMLVLRSADTLAESYLFAVLNGITGSGINTLAPILWANYYGRATLGSIYGLSRAAQVLGFAVGPLLSGIVYDATNSYQNAFGYFAVLAVISSVFMLLARKPTLKLPHQSAPPGTYPATR